MQTKPKLSSRIRRVPVDKICLLTPPRRSFTDEVELDRLAQSIAAAGVIQPLTLAKTSAGFVVLNGARRLQAARAAGLKRVPCVVLRGPAALRELWALAGNTGCEPPSCFDLAESYARALETAEPSLVQAVAGIGEQELQAALRLLRLSEPQRRVAAAAGIGPRQAAPLAALPDAQRDSIFAGIIDSDLSLAQQAEALRARLHVSPETPSRRMGAVRDVRIFFNTLERAVEMMRQAGVQAEMSREDGTDFAELRIRIPAAAVAPSNG